MSRYFRFAVIVLLLAIGQTMNCGRTSDQVSDRSGDSVFPIPQIDFSPRGYVCYQTDQPLVIDGHLDELAWQKSAWTESFVDIEGDLKSPPRLDTRSRMLWDSTYLYVAAEMEEPHLWGTLVERDAVIYHDNDFEVFIDPDGDTHEYYELEINALGTEWDLLLIKPYRDGGPAVNSWDIHGLRTAVRLDGTINNPRDTDRGWTVEMAIPWKVLAECAHRSAPPNDGDQWRINFSRVQWHLEVVDGHYTKRTDTTTGEVLPEDNWVWSPQGLIAMHYPEMWGYLQFSDSLVGAATVAFEAPVDARAGWVLRQLYYAQKDYRQKRGRYSTSLTKLGLNQAETPGFKWPPVISVSPRGFEAMLTSHDDMTRMSITEDGRVWRETISAQP